MPQPARRRLLDDVVRKNNPYTDTISLAMERLEAIENALQKDLPKALQSIARQKLTRRRVIRMGYTANTDSQGWTHKLPEGRLYTLKRITIVADATGAYGLFIGSQDAGGLREVMNATQAVTFNNGATGYGYSDAFSNDIVALGGQDIYIQFLGGAGAAATHTIVASLEIEFDAPVKRDITESENYAIQVEPLETERDEVDGTETGLTGDRPDLAAHFSPDTEMDMEGDNLSIVHTQEDQEETETQLLPNAAAHLPEHLR